ncbi:MAG TPA: ATP-binding protein [Candidatus Angelobacter sp.]|nr:ATP-binding protein [Candidatus Angelobacter sp.]
MNAELVSELRKIDAFHDLPEDALAWLADHATVHTFQPGELIMQEGEVADRMTIILEGELQGRRESLGPDAPVYTGRAGQVTGMLPFSRMTHYTITGRALGFTRIATIPSNSFPEMLQQIPTLGPRLVGVLTDRVREVTKLDLQRDKLAALGKLSAGLAHELNNPASAGSRAAASIRDAFERLRAANAQLDNSELSAEQKNRLRAIETSAQERQAQAKPKDALQQSDAEEFIGTWLDRSGVHNAWELASVLAEAEFDIQELEPLKTELPPEALTAVVQRLTTTLDIYRLLEEIQNSTGRISDLVRAIKEYSFMDQAPRQQVDVVKGIENTLTILTYKLKHGVSVIKEFDPKLPKIFSYGSELNQVWTNLLDNAIDAMKGKGAIRIRTCREGHDILVEIADNGPGIPTNIQPRIFDPFFTTKGVGDGSGLGLDTVYRIVRQHHGNISFTSQPGNTCFRVRLPIEETQTPADH